MPSLPQGHLLIYCRQTEEFRNSLRSRAFCWNGGGLDRDRGEFGWVDIDEAAVLALVLEADDAVYLGEEGVILAAADVGAGLERGAALTDDDTSAEDGLSAEYLDAEPLGV